MKMCLKLAYYAFSSSPPKDAMIIPLNVVFLHFLLKFTPFDEFFPFQNMIANLSVCVASVVVVCVCVHVHPLNILWHLSSYRWQFFWVHFTKDGRMGHFEVCHRFVLKFKPFKVWWPMSLFIFSYCNSCSACEMSFLTGKECPGKCAHCRSPRQKKVMYMYSLGQLERL